MPPLYGSLLARGGKGGDGSPPSASSPFLAASDGRGEALSHVLGRRLACSKLLGGIAAGLILVSLASAMLHTGSNRSAGEGDAASASLTPASLRGLSPPSLAVLSAAGPSVAGPLSFTALNEYTLQRAPNFPLYPWLADKKLVEPHRDTFLSVEKPREGCRYLWSIIDSHGVTVHLEGVAVTHQFTVLERHTVMLREVQPAAALLSAGYDRRDAVSRTHVEAVICKYVRREIRALTDEDRNEVLDAMQALWVVGSEEGRQLWGPDYTDISGLAKFHHYGAANRTCDSFHDGLGFMVAHIMMTSLFEQTVQLVNPKVSIPYWDYTIEDSKVQTDYGGDYARLQDASPIFTSEWFGTTDPDDKTVKDGRWAWTKALTPTEVDKAAGVVYDVYGLMRGPWSTNGNRYVTRGLGNTCGALLQAPHPWPTCKSHHDLLRMTDLYDWVYYAQRQPHGGIHFWIGGANDCEGMFDTIAALIGEDETLMLRRTAGEIRKTMWIKGLWACDGTVPVGTPLRKASENCGCEQAGWDIDNDDDLAAMLDVLIAGGASVEADVILALERPAQRQVMKLLCKGTIAMGDHIQSASTIDPTFWIIHGTMERLMQVSLSLPTFDTTWISKGYQTVGDDGTTETYYVSGSELGDDCIGHRPTDAFPYDLVYDKNFSAKLYLYGKLTDAPTNEEMMRAIDPAANALPYVYDSFEWPHCASQGFDMLDVLAKDGPSQPT